MTYVKHQLVSLAILMGQRTAAVSSARLHDGARVTVPRFAVPSSQSGPLQRPHSTVANILSPSLLLSRASLSSKPNRIRRDGRERFPQKAVIRGAQLT